MFRRLTHSTKSFTDKMTIKCSSGNIFREGIFDYFYFYEVTKRLF